VVFEEKLTGAHPGTIKTRNMSSILLALLWHEPLSRVRIAQMTGLSTTTVTNLVNELITQGIVMEEEAQKPQGRRKVGRPRTPLRLVAEARHAIGVHIGVGYIRVGVADLRGHIRHHRSFSHQVGKGPEEVLNETLALIKQTIAESRINPKEVVGVGIGASGLVDPASGVNVFAPNLGWRDVPLRDWFAERLQLPVCVDNNVRAMALGEAWFGAGRQARTLAFVYARIGVGAGFVVDRQLYRGSGAGAGEIGHMTVIPDGGEPCRCGNTGCLETLVSEPALVRLAGELARREPEGILAAHLRQPYERPIERVFAAARAGDEPTRKMLNERARYMGIALANLVNTFNPELIVLGGILAQGQDLLLRAIEQTVRQRSFANLGERVRIQASDLGWPAGMVGAATLALSTFFSHFGECA